MLQDIVAKRPETDEELLAISGVGTSTVKRYGAEIFCVLQGG
ncbi:MAG: HRDC domain-containing protein [Acidobacteriaceae bacterium]|nr:HRDC domain-containing protein [Acidobacteriaceae bacterium]